MITPDEARDLANNLNTPAAQQLLSKLNEKISVAATAGKFCIELTKEEDIPCVYKYLETLGYKIEVTREKEYGTVLMRKISWK
jgi:hypothetical protein